MAEYCVIVSALADIVSVVSCQRSGLSVAFRTMAAMGGQLRRIGDPVVAAAPVGARVRTRLHAPFLR